MLLFLNSRTNLPHALNRWIRQLSRPFGIEVALAFVLLRSPQKESVERDRKREMLGLVAPLNRYGTLSNEGGRTSGRHGGRRSYPNPDIIGEGSAPDLRVPACSSIATLTSFEGANGRPVFGLRRGRTAPMWQRCTPRAVTRAYAHNGPWRLWFDTPY